MKNAWKVTGSIYSILVGVALLGAVTCFVILRNDLMDAALGGAVTLGSAVALSARFKNDHSNLIVGGVALLGGVCAAAPPFLGESGWAIALRIGATLAAAALVALANVLE